MLARLLSSKSQSKASDMRRVRQSKRIDFFHGVEKMIVEKFTGNDFFFAVYVIYKKNYSVGSYFFFCCAKLPTLFFQN